MPPSSLIKFSHRTSSGGKRLFWDRSGIDGAPFRGPSAPIMGEEEFESRSVRVADARNCFFDVARPEENKLYLEVIECCFNGWFQMIYLERFWRNSTSHYVEWVEYYMEDGNRTPFLATGIAELANGHANLVGNPGAS